MANWQQHHQQFAGALKARLVELESRAKLAWEVGALTTLIDTLPYYGKPEWTTCHRDTLSNLLQINLPNDGIGNPPGEGPNLAGSITHYYTGPYSGYRDAFFHGVTQSPTAERLQKMTVAKESLFGIQTSIWSKLQAVWSRDGKWDPLWTPYSVAALTDAVRKAISAPINTSRLAEDLTRYNKVFLPHLAASCLLVFEADFTPTATPLKAIISAGNGQAAATLLSSEIRAGQFTANINQAIAKGGDDAVAAVWFLFNLWITLKALGAADVDAIIKQAQSAGLTVPNEVGPGNWWNGGYTSWYPPLSGSDVLKAASARISEAMPCRKETNIYGKEYTREPETFANGYAHSFCSWGSLNVYKS